MTKTKHLLRYSYSSFVCKLFIWPKSKLQSKETPWRSVTIDLGCGSPQTILGSDTDSDVFFHSGHVSHGTHDISYDRYEKSLIYAQYYFYFQPIKIEFVRDVSVLRVRRIQKGLNLPSRKNFLQSVNVVKSIMRFELFKIFLPWINRKPFSWLETPADFNDVNDNFKMK